MAEKINRGIFLLQMIAIWASVGDFGKQASAQSNAGTTVTENGDIHQIDHDALPEKQLRCNNLQSLRRQYYKFLSASMQMTETSEFVDLFPDEASRYDDDAAALRAARSNFEETWEQVERDMKNANDSSEMLMNQCYAGESCASDVWSRGCYTCMPGKDGSLPCGCSHDSTSNGLLHTIEINMRSAEDTTMDLNCVGDSTTRVSMEEVERQVESLSAILDEACAPENVANLTPLQAAYDNAYNLQHNLNEMRSALKQQYSDLTLQCTQPYTELSMSGLSSITDQFSKQALKINIDDSASCSKMIFLEGTERETSDGNCWIITEDKTTTTEIETSHTTASITESTNGTHLIDTTGTENVTVSESTTEMMDSQSTTTSQAITSSTTATEATCLSDLDLLITALHAGMENIKQESAKVSDKIAECMRGATSVSEMIELIQRIALYKIKLQELFVDAGRLRNTELVHDSSFISLAKQIYGEGECNQSGASLDETLGELSIAINQLKESPLAQDKQNHVLCLTQNIADILGQGEDTQ